VTSEKLLLVTATRLAPNPFMETSPLGRSLRRISYEQRIEVRPAFNNKEGLPAVYNRQITEENREKILLFLHDDLWLDDCFVVDRVREATDTFAVVGVAGCIRRLPRQPAWAFSSEVPFTREDRRFLSGVVADGGEAWGKPSCFGPPGVECKLLDGVFLAARCSTLLDSGVRFDERFMFDFYDMDFCRSAEAAGLRMGTWPIAVTHASVGNFGTPAWHESLKTYRAKWPD
jgi:GT2 family glycosyltransferase